MAERFIDEKALYPTMDILCEIGEICVEESKWHISAERAVERIRKCLGKPNVIFSHYRLEKYIDEHPIEAKPVVHAHWKPFIEDVEIYNTGGYHEKRQTGWICSKCGKGFTEFGHTKYCSDCGAQMDEEVSK